jgi:GTPase-activating protein BEM2
MRRLEQFMSLSLAAEPRRKGLFEPYFWTRSIHMHTSYTSLIPLLFPDPLPTLTLVDRSKLVRGRLESDASEMQYLRSVDAQLRQEAGRNLHNLDANHQDYIKRLILGTGGTVISLHNGNLRLVVQSGTFESESSVSRPSSNAFSRPPSSVVDHGGSEKTLSRNPSIRVKPSTSQGLDRKTSVARRSSLPSVSLLSRQNFVTSEPSLDPPLRVVVQAGTLNNLVDVLVHGLEGISVSVADDNGEMSLREGMKREVVIDRVEFARVWWNVFRSFVSPFVFFEVFFFV